MHSANLVEFLIRSRGPRRSYSIAENKRPAHETCERGENQALGEEGLEGDLSAKLHNAAGEESVGLSEVGGPRTIIRGG